MEVEAEVVIHQWTQVCISELATLPKIVLLVLVLVCRYRLKRIYIYRSKDLSLVRLEQLPSSASAFRSWRNSFLTKTCSIDATGENVILTWLTQAFHSERGEDLHHSGLLPRLDAHLASLLADTKHLKSELGMSYQSYIERCQMSGRSPKGRYMIWLLAQQFAKRGKPY